MHTWIISDTHFYHEAMVSYCGRPKDFGEKIRHHWKRMIAPEDLVYHLGDVYFGRKSQFMDCVSDLPGKKILIKGNHDRNKTEWYLQHGFIAVMQQAMIIANLKVARSRMCGFRCILTHKPVQIPVLDTYVTLNIHGHYHNNRTIGWDREVVDMLTKNHKLISMEYTGYKPVLLQNLLFDKGVRCGGEY